MPRITLLARAAVAASLAAAVACSDGPPTQPLDGRESRILPDRHESPAARTILSRMRIKIPEGATAELVLERENGRVVGMTRKDRAGQWHKILQRGPQEARADLVQSRDTAVFGTVGTFVGDGVLGAYGTNEFYDSTGAFWRVKSLWSADSPPVEEVHYRNEILVAVTQSSWVQQNGGWLLTATRTEAYDYNTGEFLVEMLDSLHHWQPSNGWPQPDRLGSPQLFASARADFDCYLTPAFYFAQSTCPSCLRTSWETAVALTGFVGTTYEAYRFVRDPKRVWNVKEAMAISVAWMTSFDGFMYSAANTTKCWTDRRHCLNGGGAGSGSGDGTIKKT